MSGDIISSQEILVRNISKDDLDDVLAVEEAAWPEELHANREKFESRLEMFPDGFFGIYVDGKLVGTLTSMLTNTEPSEELTWAELTDNGYIKNHEPKGKWLYIVSLAVSKPGVGYGSQLLSRAIGFSKERGCVGVYLQARPCEYDKYCSEKKEISIEEYLKITRKDGLSIDKEIRFYQNNGFIVVKPIENGEMDKESRNYTVTMILLNN